MAQLPLSYIFRHVTISDGLASDKVSGILLDDKGFMWISTFNGLQRYDGYSFSTWHHNAADTNSLMTDGSVCKLKDLDGNLWMFSWPWGLSVFNPHSGKCRRIFDPDLVYGIGAFLDKDGNVWLISTVAVEEYERSSHRLISYKNLLPADISMGNNICYDRRTGNIYFNSWRYGICLFQCKEKKFYYRLNNPRHDPLLDLDQKFEILLLDRDNYFWLNTKTGELWRAKPDSGKIIPCYLRDPAYPQDKPAKLHINSMMQDSRGAIWFNSRMGLLKCSRGSGDLEAIWERAGDANGFHSDGVINCFSEDPKGNIWIGTAKGINIFNPGIQKFISVPIASSRPKAGWQYSVLNFLERDDGDIWVGTYGGGIFVFDKFLQFKRRYKPDKEHPGNPGTAFPRKPFGPFCSSPGVGSRSDRSTGGFRSMIPSRASSITGSRTASAGSPSPT